MLAERFMRVYEHIRSPDELPWHRGSEPWPLLRKVVEQRQRPGRALDLGCGEGVYSTYLAKQGYQVTGIDYIEKAVELARQRARDNGVEATFVHASVLDWQSPGTFDLVLDSQCLHSLDPAERPTYRRQLLRWLAPDADYVLIHYGKLHPFDWRSFGPKRRSRRALLRELGPELTEHAYEQEVTRSPPPVGKAKIMSMWLKRGR